MPAWSPSASSVERRARCSPSSPGACARAASTSSSAPAGVPGDPVGDQHHLRRHHPGGLGDHRAGHGDGVGAARRIAEVHGGLQPADLGVGRIDLPGGGRVLPGDGEVLRLEPELGELAVAGEVARVLLGQLQLAGPSPRGPRRGRAAAPRRSAGRGRGGRRGGRRCAAPPSPGPDRRRRSAPAPAGSGSRRAPSGCRRRRAPGRRAGRTATGKRASGTPCTAQGLAPARKHRSSELREKAGWGKPVTRPASHGATPIVDRMGSSAGPGLQ